MVQGAIFRSITVVYNAAWLADNPEIQQEGNDVDRDILTQVFEEGLAAFVAAEEGVRISVVEDASRTSSYDILIDDSQPSDEPYDQELEFNTEKAVDRYFQLGTYWNEYLDRLG